MPIFSSCMFKGGDGKSSLTVFLATALTNKGNKVLLIDLDSQGCIATSYGYDSKFEKTIYDVMMEEAELAEVIVEVSESLHFVPADRNMNYLDINIKDKLEGLEEPLKLLKQQLDKVKDSYDYILIDSPPRLDFIVGNALAASDKILIPFIPEMYSVNGMISVLDAVEDMRSINPSLEAAVLPMKVDKRKSLHKAILEQAKEYCEANGVTMFKTVIPTSSHYPNSIAFDRKPILKKQDAYYELVEEMEL